MGEEPGLVGQEGRPAVALVAEGVAIGRLRRGVIQAEVALEDRLEARAVGATGEAPRPVRVVAVGAVDEAPGRVTALEARRGRIPPGCLDGMERGVARPELEPHVARVVQPHGAAGCGLVAQAVALEADLVLERGFGDHLAAQVHPGHALVPPAHHRRRR